MSVRLASAVQAVLDAALYYEVLPCCSGEGRAMSMIKLRCRH